MSPTCTAEAVNIAYNPVRSRHPIHAVPRRPAPSHRFVQLVAICGPVAALVAFR